MSDAGSGSTWQEELQASLDERIREQRPVGGGEIGRSLRVSFESGGRCFVKVYPEQAGDVAAREVEGLRWLAEAGALAVARPIAHGSSWLALDWIESGPRAADHAARLGRGLARLHATGAPDFGLDSDNWLAGLPQPNAPMPDWASFYGERRLRPMLRRARRAGTLDDRISRRLEALIESLPGRVGPDERPARLHGDLWSGNVLSDAGGEPVLIDPAVYGGHREVDLAMMRLFGGFEAQVFRAYEEVHPLAAGASERVPLYQLYPLLTHVCLFGGGYVARLARALDDCHG